MTTIGVRDSVQIALTHGLGVRRLGDAQLIHLPLFFSDGHRLELVARPVSGDLYTVTDRGQTADILWSHGLDLAAGSGGRSWAEFQRDVELPPAMGDVGEFELAMSTTGADLGASVLRLGEVMLLGEGLRVLARPTRTAGLAKRIVAEAVDRRLAVLPNAPLRTKYDSTRPVSAKVVGEMAEVYLQAVGSSNRSGSYDHARSLIADVMLEPGQELYSVVGADRPLEPWQKRALAEGARVLDEQDLPMFLDGLAA